jgi:hypothetical protein
MINLKAVRAMGNRPRVHGNGFIQLDLTERSRLHIWGDHRIPRQKVATSIHDHVFGFESTVIVGRVINVVYAVEAREHGDYRVYVPKVREGEDTILKPTAMQVVADPIHVDMTDWRSSSRKYGIIMGEFHETVAPDGPAATIIIKDDLTQAQGNDKALPRVLCPIGLEPDNVFNRYDADPDLLWRIIEQTLQGRTR